MAAEFDSDDASAIFWPGYVDAVTNLAINLLFVIAVMSIVVLTATLQISKMRPQSDGTVQVSASGVGAQAGGVAVAASVERSAKNTVAVGESPVEQVTSDPKTTDRVEASADVALEQKDSQTQTGAAAILKIVTDELQQAKRQVKTREAGGGSQQVEGVIAGNRAESVAGVEETTPKDAEGAAMPTDSRTALIADKGPEDVQKDAQTNTELRLQVEQLKADVKAEKAKQLNILEAAKKSQARTDLELNQLKAALRESEKKASFAESEIQKTIEQQAKTVEALKEQLSLAQASAATKQGTNKLDSKVENKTGPTESPQPTAVVEAKDMKPVPSGGATELRDLSLGGVVVAFATDVIELSEPETADLLKKLRVSGPIEGARWQLRVVSPAGFSEATRLAYYRINSLRNILIKNGAAPADIDMRVIETKAASANNAQVLIRLMP